MLGQTPEDAFANPGIERDVLTSWERFLSGSRSTGRHVVRAAITDSWQRCQLFLVAELRSTNSCLALAVACSFFAVGSLAGLGACAKLSVRQDE